MVSTIFRSLSRVHRVDDACDLLDVRPFMDNQPLRIGQHGWFEDPSHRRNSRRAFPGIERQRGEDRQQIGTLRRKGAERGPEIQFRIVRLLDPGAGTDRPPRRPVLFDDRQDAGAPDVSARTQMGQHLVGRPLIGGGLLCNSSGERSAVSASRRVGVSASRVSTRSMVSDVLDM
jgi:hypothetical protein